MKAVGAGALTAAVAIALALSQARAAVPPSDDRKAIIEALSKRENAPVTLVDVTYERRDRHHVACGYYQTTQNQRERVARPFGWMDGELVMRFGPDWNPATLCLIKHYNAPLP